MLRICTPNFVDYFFLSNCSLFAKKWCSFALINHKYRFEMTATYLNWSVRKLKVERNCISSRILEFPKHLLEKLAQKNHLENFRDLITEHSKLPILLKCRFSKIGDYPSKHCDISFVSFSKTSQSFSFRFITTKEKLKLLNSVNVRKSTGPSHKPLWALEDCSAYIVEIF